MSIIRIIWAGYPLSSSTASVTSLLFHHDHPVAILARISTFAVSLPSQHSGARFDSIPPEPKEFPRQSSLDPSLLDRVLLPLEAFIEHLGIIDDPVPLYVARSISYLFEASAKQKLKNEYDILWILQNVRMVVLEAVAVVESSFSVDLVHVSELESETGEMNLFTHNIDIHEDVKAVSVGIKHPRVLYRYATELRESQVYEPVGGEGGRAMAVKTWLQEYTCTPQAKFGLFFSGISAILTERVTYDSGEHALLVSPHYHLFDGDNSPVCDSCTPHDEGGIPHFWQF